MICGASILPAREVISIVSNLARGLPVEFLGWRDDVASVLAELDLLVVPSKEEGMGRVLAGGVLGGRAGGCFRAGGIPEVVTDGETGFLVTEMYARGARNPNP